MTPETGEGRRESSRRSGLDRRTAERRRRELAVAVERRDGEDRRISNRRTGAERRSGFDRRAAYPRLTPAPYSSREAEQIKQMVSSRASRPACPRCNDSLIVGPVFRRGRYRVREVHCGTCRHAVMINGNADISAPS